MQKLTIAPQIDERNKKVLVCAGVLASYTVTVCYVPWGESGQ